MDRRVIQRLEEERDRSLRQLNKEKESLDRYYSRAVRENDSLIQRTHYHFSGEVEDFTRYISKVKRNEADFESALNKRKRALDEKRREISREFDRKTRT
ncbi:hypothetical protein [Lactovum odontotermitis]